MAKYIVGPSGEKTFQTLYDAGLIDRKPSDVRRVIIDLEAGAAARIYIDQYLDSSFVDLIASGVLDRAPD